MALRFDPDKVPLDPYERAVIVPDGYSRQLSDRRGDNTATAMKSVVTDPRQYDWEGDAPLRRPFATMQVARNGAWRCPSG
jgi:glycogen operon protein